VTLSGRPVGHFITIEGPDGAGKTLQAKRVATAIAARGHDVLLTREPGGTRLGEQIRDVLMANGGEPIDPIADALLFNAARAQHVARVIRPALAAGCVVICARYADSTMAYQGYGGGVDLDALRGIIRIATGGLVPDRTILLDLPAEAGLRRKTPDHHTRFETAFDVAFHLRVRAGFLEMAAADPARWIVVEADRHADAVFADVLAVALADVEAALPGHGRAESEPAAQAARINP
jgi:dTMP kinase